MKRVWGALLASALLLTGCSAKAPDDGAAAQTHEGIQATAIATAEASNGLEGAVDIEGAYENGKMSASVGPVYRLKSGATVLALTEKVSPDIDRYPGNYSVAMVSVSPDFGAPTAYSGMHLLDDAEVFEPLMADGEVSWLPQDPKLDKKRMHPVGREEDKDGLSESVLVPFGKIADVDRVGVSVGLIGFAGDVPVVPISDAPKDIQSVAAKMEPALNLDEAVHSPYTSVVQFPGLDVDSSKDSLDVTLAADVFFDSGSWDIKPEGSAALDQLVQALVSHEPGEVAIVGHTDDVPDTNVGNQVLSENRANAVKGVLEQRPELAGFSFVASGKGDSEPANPGHDEKARAENRRVTVAVKTPVKRDILEGRAVQGQLPAPAGKEATWPDTVEYSVPAIGSGKPDVMNVSASKAVAYPNYTVVNYTITAKSKNAMYGNLLMGHYKDFWLPSLFSFAFFGADIVRGETRTLPLKYERMSNGRLVPRFVATGGVNGMDIPIKENDQITIPVIYPPTKDEKITIDVNRDFWNLNLPNAGWRIKDIPVVPGTEKDSDQDDK